MIMKVNMVKKGAARVCGSIRAAFGEGIEEGLPKGYFKKEFGVGKKKSLKKQVALQQ